MNVGEVMVLLALAGWFVSPALVIYALLAWLAWHLFVVLWDEPTLLARFGERYARYRAATNRWMPRSDPGPRE